MSTAATIPTSGANQKAFYAQQIIDAFSKSLDANGCLTKIPIAIYTQINSYQQNLNDALSAMGQSTTLPTNTFSFIAPAGLTTTATTIQDSIVNQDSGVNANSGLVSSIKNSLLSECIPCSISLPSFNLGDVFGQLLSEVENFINDLTKLFNPLTPTFCHFAYFLSFLCIPDLVRILATLLARILQLTANLSLPSLSVSAFIQGILGVILQALMNIVLGLVNFALAPITCLLNSIESLIQKIPTPDNLAAQLTSAQYQKLTGQPKPAGQTASPGVQPYLNQLKGANASTLSLITNEFKQAQTLIQDAGNGIQQQFQDLLGLKNFMHCENQRNGGIFDNIQLITDIIQLVNVIAAVLGSKVQNAVTNALCQYEDNSGAVSSTNPLSVDDIATVIQNATNGIVDIIQNDAGTSIGILVTPTNNTNPNNLSIYSCNMADFIKNNTLDNLITQTVNGQTFNPGGPRARISLDKVTPTGNQIQVLFNDSTLDPTNVVDAINQIYGYNPLQDKSELNYYSVSNPKPVTGPKLIVAPLNSSIGNLTKTGAISYQQFIIPNTRIVSGNLISKPVQIKSGSIDNIKSNLGLVIESI